MDPKPQDSQNSEGKPPSDHQSHLPIVPFTSITLSFPQLLPTHFISSPKISPFSPKIPTTIKIPSQISSLFNLSLSSTTTLPTKSLLKSTVSANPLQNPLPLNPRRPSDPSNPAGLRRASVVWFRNDLRVQDNESLTSANNESMSVLPLYCFDPTDFGKSSSGFDKTGPHRASFLIESVSDLRKNLQARGSDLIVRIGKPETILAELVKEVGAEAVYAHREVSNDEVKGEEKIEMGLKDEGVEIKYFWGSTLYHIEDLPFKLEEMPTNYGGFREKVKGLKVRKTIEALAQLKGLPSGGDIEPGEIPSLVDLGLNPSAAMSQAKPVSNGPLVGGETEALQRLKRFAAECQAQPPKETKDGNNDSIYGANFSCKISPWLAMGCLSPRSMFDELKKSASRTVSAGKDGDGGMNWLMYELLWRDFFRFITRKYSSSKQRNIAPVTACTA
ncbi:blue-light photoreceptor PHR2-like [Cynara cardunculus var. scolymus]|uniref:blue-light photoreceptor PHR2-like n=1 Tax=Cynara cardunculus var. scolymus TaxID=59895 RepID=UPI000D623A64|nr:blue-light photoreceptor PHR2-like [Cynara cardunculus var. scolymus]